MRNVLFIGGIAAAVLLTPLASSAQVLLSTGLDASNNLILAGGLADAHWTVSEQAGGMGAAQTVYPNNPDWFGGWLANGPFSDWIARNANLTDNGPAPYTFQTSFDLTGFDPTTATISGSWAIDDQGVLDLNGNLVSTIGNGNWGALTNFGVPAGSPDFLPGINTLSITITSDDDFLEAVRLQGLLSASAASNGTPEPGSLALFGGLFAAGAGFTMKRRARK